MGAACHKENKNFQNQKSYIGNPKLPSNASLNAGSKVAIPILQQPQLNSLNFGDNSQQNGSSKFKSKEALNWSNLEGIDPILEKITSFDINETIRENNTKADEIVKLLRFKNNTEACLTILQLLKKISQNEAIPTSDKNNADVNTKLNAISREIKNNFIDVFHMLIGKLHTSPQIELATENLWELLAKLIQVYQMMIFFKDLKIKEFFFRDKTDNKVLQTIKELLSTTKEKIKSFLNEDIKNEEREKIFKNTQNDYLSTLYEQTVMKLYNDQGLKARPIKLSTNKIDFFLNHCDLNESFEETSYNKPSESLLLCGVKKNKNKNRQPKKIIT